MKRRKFVLGLGALSGTGALAIGTGAFTSVSAGRRLQVQTANDSEALLRLEQLGDGQRSVAGDTPTKVEFLFPGNEEFRADPSLGLGTDSVYEFDRDADKSDDGDPVEGLLRIGNQGTQPVEVYSEHRTSSELEVELYDVTDDDRTALHDDPAELDVGESVDVGFRIRTFGADIGTFDETLTIVAEV